MAEQKASDIYKLIKPLMDADNGAKFRRITQQISRTTNTTTNNSTGGTSDSAALNNHAALDWILAHPTKAPEVNKTRTYYSANFGIVGGAGVDESNNILAMLNAVGATGGGTCVICADDPANPIHIAKTISIYYSNIHVVFPPGQAITYEDKGSMRIMGDYAQITRKIDGTAMKLQSASTVVSNETVLQLSGTDTALMDAEAVPANRIVRVGDKIVVRGQNDASGKAIEKDTSFVKSLAKVGSYWEITCTDELDYTFQPTYPASEWPPDLTTGTTIYIINGSLLTVSTTVNITTATVADGTVFAVGDMVEVGDNRNEYAMNASAITGAGNPYKNPANLEQAQIIAISGNVLTFDHALCRAASTTYYGFVALMVPVVNSTISGARISYTADGIRSANALQITYSMDCHVHDCYVYGLGGRKGHGLRISYSYKCTAYRNHIVGAKYTGSGEGYGITIYYATLIMVDHNFISGCRHNILLQLATLAKVIANVSIDDRISGIDLHGVYSVRCSIQNNDVSRSSLNTSDSTKPGGIRIGNTSHTGGDHYNVIEGNTVTGYSSTTADGIDIFAASTGNVIRNNTVIDCTVGLRFGLNSKQITPVQFIDNTIVEGNIFSRCTSRTIEIIAQPVYDNIVSNGKFSQITFINNISDGNDRHFEITGVVTNLGITDVIMVGNQVINPVNTTTTYYGISVKYVDGFVHVFDNNVSKAQRGIYLQGNGVCQVVGNKTASTVQADPYTDGTGNTSVNYVDAMTASGSATPTFTDSATITGINPQAIFIETGVTADNTRWDLIANGETFAGRVVNDANSAAANWVFVERTANTIDSVDITATNINLNGIVNLTGGSASPTFTTGATVTGANPQVIFIETGVTADNTRWDLIANGETFAGRAVNDANSAASNWVFIERTGTTIDYVTFPNGIVGFGTTSPAASAKITVDGISRIRQAGSTRYRSEYYVSAAATIINSYDDTGTVYLPLNMDSSSFNVRPSGGSTMLSVTSSGAILDNQIRVRQPGSTRYRSDHYVLSAETTINSYDDTGAVYLPLNMAGSTVALRPNSSTAVLTASTTGVAVTGDLSASGNFGTWSSASFTGTWADIGGSDSACRYRKFGDIVFVEGVAARSGTSGLSVFTLPSGSRPAKHKWFFCGVKYSGTFRLCRVEIATSGLITITDPTEPGVAITFLMLDGISFSTT